MGAQPQGTYQGGTIPGLDGLRAISILLVIVSHSGLQNNVPGVLGVTIFFFISGFLITSLMLREQAKTGTIALGMFYMRRLLRLYPPLIVFIAISVMVWVWTGNKIDLLGVGAALFYFANYTNIFAPGAMQGMGGQLWSLAVEEHFYVFYPLLLLALFPRRFLILPVLGTLCALALVVRVYVSIAHPGIATDYTGMATECRIDAILFGAITAILWQRGGSAFVERWTRPHVVATALLVIVISLLLRDPLFRSTIRYTLQEIALVPLVLATTITTRYGLVQRVLNSAPMVHIGKLSYSLYLWHLGGLALGEWLLPGTGWTFVAAMMVGWVATFLFSTLCYRYIETPCFGLRRHFGSKVRAPDRPQELGGTREPSSAALLPPAGRVP